MTCKAALPLSFLRRHQHFTTYSPSTSHWTAGVSAWRRLSDCLMMKLILGAAVKLFMRYVMRATRSVGTMPPPAAVIVASCLLHYCEMRTVNTHSLAGHSRAPLRHREGRRGGRNFFNVKAGAECSCHFIYTSLLNTNLSLMDNVFY